MNVSGTEVTGVSDPAVMFIIFGLIICIAVLIGIGYSIYSALN